MSSLPESTLRYLQACLRLGEWQGFQAALDALPMSRNFAENAERQKLRGWAELAQGHTEQAYHLFQSAPFDLGAKFGILALTVLANQLTTAIKHWQLFCQTLKEPPTQLPDAPWHSRHIALAMIHQLQQYPFPADSSERGAAGLYTALLYHAIEDTSNAFWELSKVVDFYPMAALVRDSWLEKMGCLPAPKSQASLIATRLSPGHLEVKPHGTAEAAVQTAARFLLYSTPASLERKCLEALNEKRWDDALEYLRRLLVIDPQHISSLEKRWRLYLQMGCMENAQADLLALIEIYEKEGRALESLSAAHSLLKFFPKQEQTLLKMCFLQARLANPLQLAHYGRKLLTFCHEQGLKERYATYRLWLLRQELSLDDRAHFEG